MGGVLKIKTQFVLNSSIAQHNEYKLFDNVELQSKRQWWICFRDSHSTICSMADTFFIWWIRNNMAASIHRQWSFCEKIKSYFDGLVQDCSNSSALTMGLLQSCTKPSICISPISQTSRMQVLTVKDRNQLHYVINIMTADTLAMEVARAFTAMILT